MLLTFGAAGLGPSSAPQVLSFERTLNGAMRLTAVDMILGLENSRARTKLGRSALVIEHLTTEVKYRPLFNPGHFGL
jgi:hypothetical protein